MDRRGVVRFCVTPIEFLNNYRSDKRDVAMGSDVLLQDDLFKNRSELHWHKVRLNDRLRFRGDTPALPSRSPFP